MSSITIEKGQGFSLFEMVIVLLILSSLLGIIIMPLSAQQDIKKWRQLHTELENIKQALYGYAITYGALPCPTFPDMAGVALDASTTNCERNGAEEYNGFVPATSLGLNGRMDCYGLLLDPWGQPYRYSVSSQDVSGNKRADFLRNGEIRNESRLADRGLAAVEADLRICTDAAIPCDGGTAAASLLADKLVAVVFSLGKHNKNLSDIENENAGEAQEDVSGDCSAPSFGLNNDKYFYKVTETEQVGEEFDDEFIWIATGILYGKMLTAGQLP